MADEARADLQFSTRDCRHHKDKKDRVAVCNSI